MLVPHPPESDPVRATKAEIDQAEAERAYWREVGMAIGGLVLEGWSYRDWGHFLRNGVPFAVPGWLAERVLHLYRNQKNGATP